MEIITKYVQFSLVWVYLGSDGWGGTFLACMIFFSVHLMCRIFFFFFFGGGGGELAYRLHDFFSSRDWKSKHF